MIRLVITSLLSWQVLGEPIVGGKLSDVQMHPWLVSIQENGRHLCVGSIISKSVILTAAHCVTWCSPESLIVRVGTSRVHYGGTCHRVVAIKIHESYLVSARLNLELNDVALLRVSPPFEFGSSVAKIQLAEKGHEVTPGTSVSVAGWGAVANGSSSIVELKSADLHVVDSATCSRAYFDKTGKTMRLNNLICAAEEGSDACSGDSGGPLVARDIQVGIVSTGLGCADPKFPGVYTGVARHREWINTNSRILESAGYSGRYISYSCLPNVPTIKEHSLTNA